jgi:hypothetical protein
VTDRGGRAGGQARRPARPSGQLRKAMATRRRGMNRPLAAADSVARQSGRGPGPDYLSPVQVSTAAITRVSVFAGTGPVARQT